MGPQTWSRSPASTRRLTSKKNHKRHWRPTLVAPNITETIEAGQLTWPLFSQKRGVSAPAAASIPGKTQVWGAWEKLCEVLNQFQTSRNVVTRLTKSTMGECATFSNGKCWPERCTDGGWTCDDEVCTVPSFWDLSHAVRGCLNNCRTCTRLSQLSTEKSVLMLDNSCARVAKDQ